MRVCSVQCCGRAHYARNFCNAHYQRWRRSYDGPKLSGRSLEERFWSKVNKTAECWLWTGGIGSSGYGNFGKPSKLAHRVAYELEVGAIPDGLELDHLCRVRRCVNPAHLEPVTARVNGHRSDSLSGVNVRKTRCARGHDFDEANTGYRKGRGGRYCRTCRREDTSNYRARHRAGR